MKKLTFLDKVDLTVSPVSDVNKITASNLNEIKEVVNYNSNFIGRKFEGEVMFFQTTEKANAFMTKYGIPSTSYRFLPNSKNLITGTNGSAIGNGYLQPLNLPNMKIPLLSVGTTFSNFYTSGYYHLPTAIMTGMNKYAKFDRLLTNNVVETGGSTITNNPATIDLNSSNQHRFIPESIEVVGVIFLKDVDLIEGVI